METDAKLYYDAENSFMELFTKNKILVIKNFLERRFLSFCVLTQEKEVIGIMKFIILPQKTFGETQENPIGYFNVNIKKVIDRLSTEDQKENIAAIWSQEKNIWYFKPVWFLKLYHDACGGINSFGRHGKEIKIRISSESKAKTILLRSIGENVTPKNPMVLDSEEMINLIKMHIEYNEVWRLNTSVINNFCRRMKLI
jgi:hypothetical protein